MNGLSNINSGGVRDCGGYGSMSSDQVAVNAYESLDAGLTIQTREGDVVTLSASRFSQLDAYEYSSRGEFTGEKGSASAIYNEREITLSSGERFAFTVKGDLNEKELKDIESIVAGVDEIIGQMAQGDMDDAVAKALSMGSYESISRYAADITIERSYAAYSENRMAGYGQAGGSGMMPAAVPEQDTSFMDEVHTFLEQQKQEALAAAREPLTRLFEHHLGALKHPEDDKEAETVESVEDLSLYQTLASAAERVDELISTMVKDLFANRLDHTI